MTENSQLTSEQYKIQVMRSRFAESVANYEDQISDLLTNLAIARQEIQRLTEEDSSDGSD